MFSNHRDIVAILKNSNAHFKNIFDEHNRLDAKINAKGEHMGDMEVENMKKKKLKCKDELYQMIQAYLKEQENQK